MDKVQVLNEYLSYKKLSVRSLKIKDIENYTKQFLDYTSKPLVEYNEKDLIDYLNSIGKKYSMGTQNFIKVNLKNFIKWYFIDWSARFRNLDKVCRSERPPSRYTAKDMISESQFEDLIRHEDSFFWKGFFLTMFYGGCRPNEVCSLKWKDLEFESNDKGAFFTIYSNKNKNKFIKYIPEKAAFYLRQLQNNNSEFVFFNPQTKLPVTKKGAYWKIRKLSKKVLGKSIDLYTLRHSIATILYSKDMKDDLIALQMGHTKSMKNVYVHNDLEKIKDNARKIYFEPDKMPPQEENKLLNRIKELEDTLNNRVKALEIQIEKNRQNTLKEISPYSKEEMKVFMLSHKVPKGQIKEALEEYG